MKKLNYLFVALTFTMLTACGGGTSTDADTVDKVEVEVKVCSNTGEPCLEDHSCCAAAEDKEAKECCDGTDPNCCAGEGHDHDHEGDDPDHEGHDHE